MAAWSVINTSDNNAAVLYNLVFPPLYIYLPYCSNYANIINRQFVKLKRVFKLAL